MNYSIPFETIWAGMSHKANGHPNESRLEDIFHKAYEKAENEELSEAEMIALLNSYGDALEDDKANIAAYEAFWASNQGKIRSIKNSSGADELGKETVKGLYFKVLQYLNVAKAEEYINLVADAHINGTEIPSPVEFLIANGISQDEL